MPPRRWRRLEKDPPIVGEGEKDNEPRGKMDSNRALSNPDAHQAGLSLPAGLLAALFVAVFALLGIGARFCTHGDPSPIHSVLSLFFSINLLVCYWEICLFFRRDYIERRTDYWRERQRETGRKPTGEFLASKVPLTRILSPTVWADAWATYAQYDSSYADRRTFGFNVDIGNGFVTPLPTLILYAAYTFDFLPAPYAGIIGAMVFWQWIYATTLYGVSFFVAKRQTRISRLETFTFIIVINSFWVLCALLGLYVSVRLIMDGNYSVLGS